VVLCTNGHNNAPDARFCTACGVNTFHPDQVTSPDFPSPPTAYPPTYTPATPYAATPYSGLQVPYQTPWNGFAITSLILGIVWIYWIGSLLAVIFGIIALSQISERHDRGKGMAITGIVLGGLLLVGLIVLVIVAAFHVHKVVTN
jgi:hypothetical protein